MNALDDHEVFEELAAGHALSALEPAEEQVFRGHLAACTRCQRDVADHEATLALLAHAADPVEPPASVLEGIRAGLPSRSASSQVGGASSMRSSSAPSGSSTPSESASARVVPLERARSHREHRSGGAARWLGAAAAAAVVLSLGAWNLVLRAGQEDAQDYSDRLAVAVRELASPESQDVALTGEDGDVVAVAVVRDGDVSVVVDGLAPNGDATSYVLWAQDGSGAVRPVGAFDVDEEQVDVVTGLGVDAAPDAVTAFLVSEEQGDEAPAQPAGPVLASGEV